MPRPHFGHVFSGDGYSAGYYSYLWSEVLDADGFGAFTGADPFDPAAARRLYDNIYSGGGTRDFAQAYRDFRGRDPEVEALLEGRGLETTLMRKHASMLLLPPRAVAGIGRVRPGAQAAHRRPASELPVVTHRSLMTKAPTPMQLVAAALPAPGKATSGVLLDLGGNWCPDCIVLANLMLAAGDAAIHGRALRSGARWMSAASTGICRSPPASASPDG